MDAVASFKIHKMSPQLLVADLERCLDFYTKILGFDLDFRYEDFYAGISKDGCSIHLKEGNPTSEKGREESEKLDIVFAVEGIEDLYQDIARRPVGIGQPLRVMPYGKEFYITDPDGHVIAFSET